MSESSRQLGIHKTIDAKGLSCPMPSVKTALALEQMEVGQVVEIITDDPVSRKDLPVWAQMTGNELVDIKEAADSIRIYIRKG
ncbi:MAG: sulfurtransferase TusA family protein [Nitrospirota bacterium]|nr:sulfurtransferase TusA family protein [Nitrospirota bacterium]